jgi:hypothetical protein
MTIAYTDSLWQKTDDIRADCPYEFELLWALGSAPERWSQVAAGAFGWAVPG